MKDYPSNKEEYWQLVDRHWEDLFDIIFRFAPDFAKLADEARLKKDDRLSSIFEEAWANAPDSPHIHYIPSWNVLCNLCSEVDVLFDEERNPYSNIDEDFSNVGEDFFNIDKGFLNDYDKGEVNPL